MLKKPALYPHSARMRFRDNNKPSISLRSINRSNAVKMQCVFCEVRATSSTVPRDTLSFHYSNDCLSLLLLRNNVTASSAGAWNFHRPLTVKALFIWLYIHSGSTSWPLPATPHT